jgi:hypothetical protein
MDLKVVTGTGYTFTGSYVFRSAIGRDAPDIRADNLAFFYIRYLAKYRIWLPGYRYWNKYLFCRKLDTVPTENSRIPSNFKIELK